MSASISTAILEIRKAQDGGHAEVSVTNEDINRITWHDGNPTNITNQQITDKQAEISARDAHIAPRALSYPTIGDQLDMIYHDQVDGTTTFKEAIQAIKDANPKP